MFRVSLPAGLLVFLLSCNAVSGQGSKWFEVSSKHFLLFTDSSQSKGERVVADLETRVSALADLFGELRPMPFPIEIFEFNKFEDFQNAAPGGSNAKLNRSAYVVHGPDRAFVIARDRTPDGFDDEVGHAIGHIFFEHQVLWRPFWLEEGVAEYFRKVGHSVDKKTISEKDAFSVGDLLTIVPSKTYDDGDPDSETFRLESFRFLQLVLDQNPDALRAYVKALGTEGGKDAALGINVDEAGKSFPSYVEKAISAPSVLGSAEGGPADEPQFLIHEGDMLAAAGHTSDASRCYNGDSEDARAARAILSGVTRPINEGFAALSRAAKDLPNSGLVQYHFGALVEQDKKDWPAQQAALESATKLLPEFGPAFAQLARVNTLSGKPQGALQLLDHAVELSPEYGDRFFEIRADVDVALNHYDDASLALRTAQALPHSDRKAGEAYETKIDALTRKVDAMRRVAEGRDVDRLRAEVESRVQAVDPPAKPEPPPPPVAPGRVTYDIEARSMLQVATVAYPDYPEDIRRTGAVGKIVLRVEIGTDGAVKNAAVVTSQIPSLNVASLEAAKKWTFKLPAGRAGLTSIKLTFSFLLS
jgi:TonB family protein